MRNNLKSVWDKASHADTAAGWGERLVYWGGVGTPAGALALISDLQWWIWCLIGLGCMWMILGLVVLLRKGFKKYLIGFATLVIVFWLGRQSVILGTEARQSEEDLAQITKLEDQLATEKERSESFLSFIESNLGSSNRQHAESTAPARLLGAVNLQAISGVNSDDHYREKIQQLRDEFGLEEISSEQLGVPLNKSRPGTYCVALSHTLGSANRSRFQKILASRNNYPGTPGAQALEIHTRKDGSIYLIVFLTESDAARIANLDGHTERQVVVFPYWSEERTVIVPINTDRIFAVTERNMKQSALQLTLR